jgi:hypothetical protein
MEALYCTKITCLRDADRFRAERVGFELSLPGLLHVFPYFCTIRNPLNSPAFAILCFDTSIVANPAKGKNKGS